MPNADLRRNLLGAGNIGAVWVQITQVLRATGAILDLELIHIRSPTLLFDTTFTLETSQLSYNHAATGPFLLVNIS